MIAVLIQCLVHHLTSNFAWRTTALLASLLVLIPQMAPPQCPVARAGIPAAPPVTPVGLERETVTPTVTVLMVSCVERIIVMV